MKKQIISLGLASTLLLSTVAFANPENEKVAISENTDNEVVRNFKDTQKDSSYLHEAGKITEVNREKGRLSILIEPLESTTEGIGPVKLNITEQTVLLGNDTADYINDSELVEGAIVDGFFSKDAPMTRSLPPMVNADVVVLRRINQDGNLPVVKVDTFDEELISIDNFLKVNITKDTKIVDRKGNLLNEKDIYNRDLIVFYGPAITMSIPALSNATKIIRLSDTQTKPNNEVKAKDKIIYNGKEINLKNKLYKSGDFLMMPIREVGEALGYKISWNNKTRQVELTKGANYLTATVGEDMYSFSKRIVKLGKGSLLENGTTYVPVKFIEEVMQLDVNINNDGVINVK